VEFFSCYVYPHLGSAIHVKPLACQNVNWEIPGPVHISYWTLNVKNSFSGKNSFFSKIGTELSLTLFLPCLAICCSYLWTECCYCMLPIHCI
jgi:hypothetical protein